MRACLVIAIFGVALSGCVTRLSVQTGDSPGLKKVRSAHTVEQTTQRLQAALDNAGMTQFGIVDHAAGATAAGLDLRATRVVIFGNPKAGTPLMRCAQTVAICAEQCDGLIEEGVDRLHLYTMNKPDLPYQVCQALGVDPVPMRVAASCG